MAVFRITRRRLLVGAGGALVVAGAAGLWLGLGHYGDRRFRQPVDRGDAFAPNLFLAVQPDDEVVIWLTRSEMGQGVMTALPLIIAEELDADWSRVRVEQAIADGVHDYGRMLTVASASVRSQWVELRRAGAIAREMLVAAAAQQWRVPRRECVTDSGRVLHASSGREARYGELAEAAAARRLPLRPRLKSPDEFRLIGHSVPRLEVPAKVRGQARYGLDVRLPGMRFCAIARAPTIGGQVRGYDADDAYAVAGVENVFEVSSGVAVVATDSYAAMRGRDALAVEWAPGPHANVSSADVSASLHDALGAADASVARDDGEVTEILAAADAVITADYEVPFLAHATMEPMNCTVHVHDGKCEVWAPTQAPVDARDRAARVADLPVEHVVVHTTQMGGGFGRRTATDFVAEAVEVSARHGGPVQVLWSREDDLRHGEFRDASAHRLEAVLADDGTPRAWRHRCASAVNHEPPPGDVPYSAVMGAQDLPYGFTPVRVEWKSVPSPVRLRIWRSVGHSYTAFAVESFVDELAAAAGEDPLDYRRRLAAPPRLQRCLEEVADMAAWHARDGRWLGLAAVSCFGSHVAQVAELVGDDAGGLRVARVWCAVDCGTAVHPDTVIGQVEGGILFGLSAALYGRITVRDGTVVEDGFSAYRLLLLRDTPEVHVSIVPSAEAPGGVGEVGVPAIAPAVANALFAARGERARTLPLQESLRAQRGHTART